MPLQAKARSAGVAAGVLGFFHVAQPQLNPLPFFGVYCLLIGYLIVRSTFLPHTLGILMMIGGLSWLTFAYLPLARALAPYNYVPGILAEGLLTLWLVAFGIDARRWSEQAPARA